MWCAYLNVQFSFFLAEQGIQATKTSNKQGFPWLLQLELVKLIAAVNKVKILYIWQMHEYDVWYSVLTIKACYLS